MEPPAGGTGDTHRTRPPQGIGDPALSALLARLNLSRYERAFARKEITLQTAKKLNNEDLKEMDIPLGPRKELLEAFAEMAEIATRPFADLKASKEPPATGALSLVHRSMHANVDSEIDEKKAREEFQRDAALLQPLREPQAVQCVGLSRGDCNELVLSHCLSILLHPAYSPVVPPSCCRLVTRPSYRTVL